MRARYRLPALLSFPLAAVLAACAAGGIVMDAALVGMHVSVRMAGGTGAPLAPLVLMLALSVAALAGMLRRLQLAGTAS